MSGFNASIFTIVPANEVAVANGFGQPVNVLPLNIIGLIVSHLDNIADLARICRTSRQFYYMTLPTLYDKITLTSYDTIRYKDHQPEGCGSASPFSMGLNALVTRNVASLVRSLTLQGEWREHDLKEYSRVGRVPDDAMMLNIAVRAAVDRCKQLENFKWDLSTKMLSPVYLGLSALPKLESLYLRCPSSRSPRPTIEIPPIPNLKRFTLTEYDPLCYPDDIASLLLRSTKLESLHLHFSPRMRDAGEPSVHFMHLFRKNVAAQRPLKLKSLGLYNLFAMHYSEEMEKAFSVSRIRHITFINSFGADEVDEQSPDTLTPNGFWTFIDNSWTGPPKTEELRVISQRHDRLNSKHVESLGDLPGLERLYMVNARHHGKHDAATRHANGRATSRSPPSVAATPATRSDTSTPGSSTSKVSLGLRDMYIEAICRFDRLQHLVFPARWPLPVPVIARLFRACPNLTQLALAMDCDGFQGLRMLVPFLSKLWAIRLLIPETSEEGRVFVDLDDDIHEEIMGKELAEMEDFPVLRYVGLGWKTWQICGLYEDTVGDEGSEGMGEVVKRRRLKRIGADQVAHVEIWKMDSVDVCEM